MFVDYIHRLFVRRVLLRHPPALNLMKGKRSIDAPPDVRVSDRLHGPEVLPGEVVFAPFRQPVLQTTRDIPAGGNQGHSAGLFKRLETSKDRDQSTAVRSARLFLIRRFGANSRLDVFQNESPSSALAGCTVTAGWGVAVAE